MKYYLIILSIICSPVVCAQTGILKIAMNENIPQSIPMHPSVTLTIQFPYEIDGLNGAGFTPDITKASGEYLISYTAPNNYFSLYPLVDYPEVRNLNIIVKGRIYVLRPYLVADPQKAWTSLVFEDPEVKKRKEAPHPSIHKSFSPPKPKLESSSTAKIIGMIDMTKLLSQVKEPVLKELLNVMPHMKVSLRENDVLDFGEYRIFLDIVSRHNKYDILVYGLRVINDSKQDIIFNPESFTVRCGEHVYTQVVSDFQGKVAPGETAVGYFAIIGTAEGTPNYLDPSNQFQVNVGLLEPSDV